MGYADLGRFWQAYGAKASTLTVTFIVDEDGALWISDRRVEHVACSRGGPVRAAGEMTFSVDQHGNSAILAISNQSTGFCPEPASWPAVLNALNRADIKYLPEGYEPAFDFRLCLSCGQINLVKEQVFECGCCGSSLPKEWNLGSPQGASFTIEGRFGLEEGFEATVIRTATKRWLRLSGFRSHPLERNFLRFWEEAISSLASVEDLLRRLNQSLRTIEALDDALSVSTPGWRPWGPGIPEPICDFAERADFLEALALWTAAPVETRREGSADACPGVVPAD